MFRFHVSLQGQFVLVRVLAAFGALPFAVTAFLQVGNWVHQYTKMLPQDGWDLHAPDLVCVLPVQPVLVVSSLEVLTSEIPQVLPVLQEKYQVTQQGMEVGSEKERP